MDKQHFGQLGQPFRDRIPFAILSHVQASGTDGGSTAATTWTICPLTAEDYDPYNIVSLAANQFTLLPGLFYIEAWQVLTLTNAALKGKLRIRNTTDGSTAGIGLNDYSADNSIDGMVVHVATVPFRLTASKVFELQYYATAAQLTTGLGSAMTSGENEKYAEVRIWKLAD